jgi:C1A family cysteine protease
MTIVKKTVKGQSRHLSGWKRQEVDPKDAAFAFKSTPALVGAATTTTCSLLQYNLPVVDQGDLGSCTANAFAGLVGINEVTSLSKKSASANIVNNAASQLPQAIQRRFPPGFNPNRPNRRPNNPGQNFVQPFNHNIPGFGGANPNPNVTSTVTLSPDGTTLTVTSIITNFASSSTTTLASIAVTPAAQSINVGATETFKATGTYSNGTVADITSAATWASSNVAVATVSGNVATGVSSGTATISAALSGITGSTTLGVAVPAPTPSPTPSPTPTAPILASRLFEYYNARLLEGTTSEDSGATIRDTITAAVKYGVANESLWAYDVTKFTVKPPQAAYTEAALHLVTSYHSIANGDLASIKAAIIAGYGVEFGFDVYSSFLSDAVANTGIVPVPNTQTETLEGGHAVVIVGFDDTTQMFLVRNSWGTDWGLLQTGNAAPKFGGQPITAPGYFLMPYAYVGNTSLSSDFWVVVSNVLNS